MEDTENLFGLGYKVKTASSLTRLRNILRHRAGLPHAQAAIQEAQRYADRFILVRIRRLGTSDNTAWNRLAAPLKIDLPNDPNMYSMGQDAHFSPNGYKIMVKDLLMACSNLRIQSR